MRLALWLIERCGVSQGLVGDVLEERSRGRSAAWVWRQVIVAIVRANAGDIRAHKWLTIRAVAVGWVVGELLRPIVQSLVPLMSIGWVATLEWRLNSFLGFPVVPLPFILVMSIGAVITGWVIARLHRGHEMPMVFGYIGFLLVFYGLGFANSLTRGLQAFGGAGGLIVNSVFPFIVTPALVVIGGLLAARQPLAQRAV